MDKECEIEFLEEILEKGNSLRFRALGGSMFPSIRPSDIITVKRVEPTEISVGEVLFYQRDGRFFAHRLTAKKKVNNDTLLFIAKGDHLPFSDPPVTVSQIRGKVVSIERGRHFIRLDTPFQRRWGQVLAVVSPWFYPLFRLTERTFYILRMILERLGRKSTRGV